ncbi:MAG TPA: hypothetical protein VJB87_01675 [Candidatus Nanoarchaeia archaeon]|nr:hypothetical protein [Candidatus Nanoarchaeia archaeon]
MRVVLLSCVKKKLSRPAPAAELYCSPLFRLALRYARSLKPDKIFVLSAKYGLVSIDEVIDPYEVTLNNMSMAAVRVWSDKVFADLSKQVDVSSDEFIFLAGSRYRKFLVPRLKHVQVPLQGLGIGKQLGWLSKHG